MESQAVTVLGDTFYNDPSQLSQALRQRAGSGHPLHFITSTESQRSGNIASAFTPALSPPPNCAAVPPVYSTAPAKIACASSPRRVEPLKYVKPALSKQHSAPTSAGMVVELEGVFKMHRSFNGLDAPGDTQPDSQMHRDFANGNFPALEVDFLGRGPTSLFAEHEEEDDDEEDDDLPSDDIEIAESSQQRNHTTITSPTVVDVDDHIHAEPNSLALTSPLKFETPALADRKRQNSRQMLSSAARTSTTPGTIASASAFGLTFGNGRPAGGPVMSLTQAWHNTQAPTSPAVGGASEDAVFTRPSPNFSNVRHSSPILAYSSPIKGVRPETPRSEPLIRSSSEPRVEYVTMEQSQEKRKDVMDGEIDDDVEEDSWNDLSRQLRARKAKEQFHRKAAKSLSHISAPALTSPQSKRNRKTVVRHSSPMKSRTPRNRGTIGLLEEGSMDDLSQPTPVKDNIEEDLSDNSSQYVPSTERVAVKQQKHDNNIQVPETSSHPQRSPLDHTLLESSPQPSPSSQLQRESQGRAIRSKQLVEGAFQPRSSRDSVAVMDSQPEISTNLDTISQPKSIRLPSSPSKNQYSIHQTTMATRTGYTSQVISSSMPPMPPKSSQGSVALRTAAVPTEEERVPSSPPLLTCEVDSTHEGDLEYDEHAYDEYTEGGFHEMSNGRPAENEDVVMDEDEDLPVTKLEAEDEEADEVKSNPSNEEVNVDLIQPQKIDLGADQEIPGGLEHEQHDRRYDLEEIAEDDLHSDPVKPAHSRGRLCQNTVPETDAPDETQPSFFPEDAPTAASVTRRNAPNQTNSTEAFQTAREELSISQNSAIVPGSSKEGASDTIRAPDRIQSLSDIRNLPETQQSQAEEEIEMPRLSDLDDDEAASGSSPKPPPAKRRKVMYIAKRSAFRSPIKSATDSDSLSNPPPSSPGQLQAEPEASPSKASTQKGVETGSLEGTLAEEDVETRYARQPTRKILDPRKCSKPLVQKPGSLKSVTRDLLQSLSSPANSPLKPKGAAVNRKSTPTTPSRSRTVPHVPKGDVKVPDAGSETDELAGPSPQPVHGEALLKDSANDIQTSTGNVLVPNRVFASWPGDHYYPATCIGRSTIRQLRIRFDDGNVTSLDTTHVRALDLRKGDHVKVDEKGMKKHTYVVVGFKNRIDDVDSEAFPMTDRGGFATVVLEEKKNESLSKSKSRPSPQHISVPIASIYLLTGLWARLRDRPFNFSPLGSPTKSVSGVATPVAESLALGSFTRRGTTAPSLLKDMTFRATSVASTAQSGSGTFSKMAFVLTSTAADIDKENIARNIKRNGGMVLELGFHELFEYEAANPPSSQSRRRSISATEDSTELTLKHAYRDLGFVALISDAHSRSTKYVQALALNIPCLHLRWVEDSLSASRALPFSKYLLPAGVSKFLDPNGVIRSRTMNTYDPSGEDTSFAQIVQDRDFLLHDQAVLLVTGKSKKEIERRQPFIFLMHALGSANVGQCTNLTTASTLLREGQWDWVYVDNGEKGVIKAAAELFETARPTHGNKAKKGKKRKRDDSEENEGMISRGDINGRIVRITSSEFVIQSLILGALVEE